MPRKTHRQRRRAYERRRRTRRRQYKQQGGEDGQKLTAWLLAANQLREEMSASNGYSAPWDFRALMKSELSLTTDPGGPMLPRFEPSSLGDILTNIAATFDASVPNGQTFIAIITKIKASDPEVYSLLQRLEAVLREEATRVTTSTFGAPSEAVDLTAVTIEKPHFLWIAYANLRSEVPEHPVLLKELPAPPSPTQTATTLPATTLPAAPTATLPPAVPSQQAQ